MLAERRAVALVAEGSRAEYGIRETAHGVFVGTKEVLVGVLVGEVLEQGVGLIVGVVVDEGGYDLALKGLSAAPIGGVFTGSGRRGEPVY